MGSICSRAGRCSTTICWRSCRPAGRTTAVHRSHRASTPSCSISSTRAPASPRAVAGQGMLLDFMGDRVIAKFQTSTCEQLKAQKAEPKTDKEAMALDFLRHDTQARIAFIDKIAAPVANKMFECDMFP